MDVSRLLVSRYIHIGDNFYVKEGVAWWSWVGVVKWVLRNIRCPKHGGVGLVLLSGF
jgi:hypothetical protein